MAVDRVASSLVSTGNDVIFRALRPGEYVTLSNSKLANDIVGFANTKHKIGFFDAAKKRIKEVFANLKRS